MDLNGHAVGIILKELVRRAMVIARRQIMSFEVNGKMGYGGEMDDFFTTADTLAQESYVKSLQECFPDIGIVGEENFLVVQGSNKSDAYFTVDPIDGTKAYIRRQSHGVGSMVALVVNGIIVSAYVGDVNSREIFGYRPESSSAWRITDLEMYEKLNPDPPEVDLGELYILLRERESKYSQVSQKTINAFKSISIDGGSIGTWAARLWMGEVGALLLAPFWETPWDSSPVIGISQKLGYRFFEPNEKKSWWEEYIPVISKEKYRRKHDMLIIHKNQVRQLAKVLPVAQF
ncbi:MAG: inositol monophosphatase family protein [Parcubacteria group bacterium]|jgi:fructose-1,6-bisphosphatase/inositol monophosphatase family enzyme